MKLFLIVEMYKYSDYHTALAASYWVFFVVILRFVEDMFSHIYSAEAPLKNITMSYFMQILSIELLWNACFHDAGINDVI